MSELNRILNHYDNVLNGDPGMETRSGKYWKAFPRRLQRRDPWWHSQHLGARKPHDVLGGRSDEATRRSTRRFGGRIEFSADA